MAVCARRSSLALVLALGLGMVSAASAEGPSGFGQFDWGTPRSDVVEKLVKPWCSWSLAIDKFGEETIACYDYQIDGIGAVVLDLDFAEGGLQGYTIMAPSRRLSNFRAWVRKQLGEPAKVVHLTGEVAAWEWPSGTTAVFRQHCMRATEACLSLSGPATRRNAAKLPNSLNRGPGH